MRTRKSAPLLVGLLLALSSCALVGGERGPEPLTPMPSEVPAGPEYASVDEVIAALAKGGFDCKVTLRNENQFGEPLPAVVDRNASGATSSEVGPGSVNLLTGDFGLSADDASAFGLSVSRTASSRTPNKGATQEGQAPIFGKEWVAGTIAEVGTADYSHIRRVSDTSVAVIDSEGDELHFTANAAKNGWIPEPGAEGLVLTGSVTGTFTLSDSQGTVTAFTKPDPTVPTWQVSSTLRDGLTNTETKIVSGKTTYQGNAVAFPQWIIAPTSAAQAATCAATPATKGCRMLEFVYPTSTTATTFTLGDVLGQVKSVRLWATAPGAASSTAQEVAAYAYDGGGRLREAWNPQISPALKTAYEYDAAGRVTRLTPPGELPWTFTYGKAGNSSAAGDGMLLKAARSGLKPATADVEEGTAATAVVYDVPLTGTGAPYGMGAADVKVWGQLDAPTDATAVFPADAVPASNDGASLTAAAYKRATVHYMGVSGRESNVAAPGGHISSTEYDRFGNPVRELSAANRAVALGSDSAAQATRADLGIERLTPAERADLLANRTVYNDVGTRQLGEFGPLRRIELTADLKSGTTVLVPAGTSVTARSWTLTEYDAGRPTNGTAKVSDQVTKVTTGAQVREYPTVQGETRSVQTVYDWVKGLPTQTIKDPGGLAITETTEYDAQGRVTKQLSPGATGTDAATRVTTYWSATGTGTCQGRPEWADQVCSTGPAGTVTGGGSQPTQLPTTTTEYDWYGRPAKTIDTANGSTRTSTTTYDGAGRATKVATTGGVGQAVPDITTEYDPVTGRALKTTSATGGTITKAFDRLGRLISYTDADGGATTTEYDLLNRPVKVTDNAPSTVTYTYDHTTEPRGLPTAVSDSVAGTFQAVYAPNGSVATEKLPGGYTATVRQDPTGAAVARTYTRDSDGTAVYSDTVTETVHGQAASHAGWSTQDYRYDTIGRLTGVDDTSDTVCTRRGYTFDARANRKSLTTATGAPGADCPTTGGSTTNHAHDSADRLVDAGYTYDAFGRTTAMPGSTLGYYANDLAYQQTVNRTRQTWALDPALRYRSWTVEASNGSTWTQTASKLNHYAGDGDNPRWIVENGSTGTVTRNVDGIAGGLAATTGKTGSTVLQLTNIHGDVAMQLPLDASQAPVALDHDEYGNARTGQAATRYGWLGANQRSTETVGGLTLMGVRLYSPASGRFLSIDPIAGGSCNRYEYACADPRNKFDLDGTYLMERVQTDCNSFNCVRMRRICESSSHKCSLQWDMWFRRAWSGAYIEAGWRYELSVRGHRVTSGSYSHGELGWYNFHGYWYGNGARGKHSCWGFTCWNDPGDSVQFHAQGIARFGYTKYWWDRFQNFGGGGSYR